MAVYLGRAGFSVTKMLPFDTLQNGANLLCNQLARAQRSHLDTTYRKKKNNPKLAQVSPQVNINEVNSHVIEAILGSATRESQRGFGRIKNTIICADPTEVRVWCIV